jgi:peptidoglycan L-alanyl-D-glutamate endopeptidase CwlK
MILHPERLRGLHPGLLRFAKEAEHVFEAEYDLAIVSGLRTETEQEALFAKGRTTPGPIVTKAQHALQTAHGRGCALDFCPVSRATGWLWEDEEAFRLVGVYGEALGLTWGGRWPMRDLGHLEVPNWRSLPFTPEGVVS